MKNVLSQKCIRLNSAWQVIGECSVEEAILQMFAGAATGMCINSENEYFPMKLDDWLKLPLRDGIDSGIHTSRIIVREPRVIICVNYSKVPRKRPKLNLKGIAQREGNKCAYTGEILPKERQSIDHIIPRSKGGAHSWSNCVLAAKEINHAKGNKSNEAVGLHLLKKPSTPMETIPSQHIIPDCPDHELFLQKK